MSKHQFGCGCSVCLALRTRIAAVLNRHKPDGDRYNEWSDCQCGHVGTRWDDHVADAVIRALKLVVQELPEETATDLSAKPIYLPREYRYVTDWEADSA